MNIDYDQIGNQLVAYLHGKLLVPVGPFRELPESLEDQIKMEKEEEFDMWYGSLIIEDKDRGQNAPIGRFLELVDVMAETLNRAENILGFSHGSISHGSGVHQKIYKCGDVVLRLTAAYDSMGKFTQCPDHSDWEHCEETNCQFEPVKIHGRGVEVHIDCMVKKQESLVAMV